MIMTDHQELIEPELDSLSARLEQGELTLESACDHILDRLHAHGVSVDISDLRFKGRLRSSVWGYVRSLPITQIYGVHRDYFVLASGETILSAQATEDTVSYKRLVTTAATHRTDHYEAFCMMVEGLVAQEHSTLDPSRKMMVARNIVERVIVGHEVDPDVSIMKHPLFWLDLSRGLTNSPVGGLGMYYF